MYGYAKVTGYSTTRQRPSGYFQTPGSRFTSPISGIGSGTYVSGTGVVYAFKNPATCGTTSATCPLYSDFLFQVGGATACRSRFDICASMRATAGADCSCGDGGPSPLGNMNFLLQESSACPTRNVAAKAGNGYDVYAQLANAAWNEIVRMCGTNPVRTESRELTERTQFANALGPDPFQYRFIVSTISPALG